MAVTSQQTVFQYTAAGSTTFAFSCRLLAADDLIVRVDGVLKTLGIDYSVNGVGSDTGGAVVFVAPLSGVRLLIQRQTKLQRLTDYQTAGDFRATVVNSDFDRAVMALQDLVSGAHETVINLRVPGGESIPPLPSAASRAGRLLGFDSQGNPTGFLPLPGDATSLALDLSSSNAASRGAGQIGFLATLSYGGGTVGAALKSLLGTAGSAAVRFFQLGTGAVSRFVQDKLREQISIADYGADPTLADNSIALQTAVNAASALNKRLLIPPGDFKYATGFLLPQFFPGIVGESWGTSRLYFNGTGTGMAFSSSSGTLGVYRDFSITAGLPSDTIDSARATLRNGIYWNCYGGTGEISNVKTLRFNGFGQKFEAIWDSCVNNSQAESCGNSSEFAWSVINGTDTSNHSNFNRVVAELSFGKAVLFEGLNNVLTGLHSERTTGDGTNYTHILRGDVTVTNGRIEASTNVKTMIGIAVGSVRDLKVNTGVTEFAWGARLNESCPLIGCTFQDVSILSANLRHYEFIASSCSNFTSAYAEKNTTFRGGAITGNVTLNGNSVALVLDGVLTVGGTVGSAGGTNSVAAYGTAFAQMPSNLVVSLRDCTVTASFTTAGNATIKASSTTFAGSITFANNGMKWRSDACTFNGALSLGSGTPGFSFGPRDVATAGVAAGLLVSPQTATATANFAVGERSYRITPASGQPKSWVCTAAGAPGTHVSEGNL